MNGFKKGFTTLVQLWKKLFRRKDKKKDLHPEKVEKDGVVYVEVQPRQLTRAGKVRFLCYGHSYCRKKKRQEEGYRFYRELYSCREFV